MRASDTDLPVLEIYIFYTTQESECTLAKFSLMSGNDNDDFCHHQYVFSAEFSHYRMYGQKCANKMRVSSFEDLKFTSLNRQRWLLDERSQIKIFTGI